VAAFCDLSGWVISEKQQLVAVCHELLADLRFGRQRVAVCHELRFAVVAGLSGWSGEVPMRAAT